MINIENYTRLPEITAQLVELDRDSSSDGLPIIKAELKKSKKKRVIKGYNPSNLVDHAGVCYIFYPNEEIKNLVLRSRKVGKKSFYDLVSKQGRPFLQGRNIRMITGISPEKIQEAFELITAPATSANKRKLTNFAMNLENRNKPVPGLHLLNVFTLDTQYNRSLGYVSPQIKAINGRRSLYENDR